MKNLLPRNFLLPVLLAAGFITADMILDRALGERGWLGWPHFALAASVLLASFFLLIRAVRARGRAEAVLRQARDELEERVQQRTAELVQANAALRMSEETTRALMKVSPESAVLLDAQGVVLAANETTAARLNTTVERLVGSSLFDWFPPDVAERRLAHLRTVVRSGQPLSFTDVRSGRTFENYADPVLDAGGNVIKLAIFSQDVTERVQREAVLRASEEKYRGLFENMAEGFALYELLYDEQGAPADWRILEVNDAYMRHTGVARQQIVGRRISELFPQAIPEYLPRFAQVVAAQIFLEFETYAKAVGRHQRVSTFPAGGARFASIIEDITGRKQSEEALRQAQEALARGIRERATLDERQRLARELHDSVSQALYGVSLGINTALTLLEAGQPKVQEALHYALSLTHAGLAEMRALIFELRPETLAREGLVAALTKQGEALAARHEIEIVLSLCDEPEAPLATKEAAYRIALEALQNTVKHARAGRLEVRLACTAESLVLEVADNGAGFDPQAPYPGHLGLQSMRERAQSVDGVLEIVSAPGRGAQIRARLPLAPAAVQDAC